MRVEGLSKSGSAVSRPEMSCEPSLPEISATPGMMRPSTCMGTVFSRTITPNEAMMSLTPFRGRWVRVFSPVMVTGQSLMVAIRGIIRRVSSPDSPVCRVSRLVCAPPMPSMVRVLPSMRIFAPSVRAASRAASLSAQGEYPRRWLLPSARAAAMIARCAKLLDAGICRELRKNPRQLP